MFFIYLIVIFAAALYLYGTRNHDYWKKRGVVHETPIPLFGTEAKRFLMQRSIAQTAADVYWKFPEEKFVGEYRGTIPLLVVRDPDLIAQILVKDFKFFSARGFTPSHKWLEPLMRNLFFADGDMWRLFRTRMTGAFTSGKLKAMFPLIIERAERLQTRTLKAAASGRPIDARDLMARYTTDFIGACGFGLDADSLNDDNSPFRKLGEKIISPTLTRGLVALFKNMFPEVLKYYKFLGQELEDNFVSFTKQTLKQRNYQPSDRNDFIDYLIKWQQKKMTSIESIEKFNPDGKPEMVQLELDDTLFAAQIFIFFVAGFETSSSATSFTLHQLAFNQEVQKQAQENIDKVLKQHDGKLSYDAVKEMTYLEWVFLEGMRIFPSSGFIQRQCTHTYTIPETDITIDAGVKLSIPIMALHNDPKYWDKPEEFRPERFCPEEAAKRHKFVYLPFGEGPRSCIGGRLGHMQSLAGLAAVLAKFTVSPAPETPRHLESDPRSTVTQSIIGGIPLVFTERNMSKLL